MASDPGELFADAYFKMHAQRVQAQQFAQDLQLKQAAQGLQRQQLSIEQQRADDSRDYQQGELGYRAGELANTAQGLRQGVEKQRADTAIEFAKILAQGKGEAVAPTIQQPMPGAIGQTITTPNPGTNQPGVANFGNGQFYRAFGNQEQADNDANKAFQLQRQKDIADTQGKIDNLHQTFAMIEKEDPESNLIKDPETKSRLMYHMMTGQVPDEDKHLIADQTGRYLHQISVETDPAKKAQMQKHFTEFLTTARPYLEMTQAAALGQLGNKVTEQNSVKNDNADILDQMNDLGYDPTKSTAAEHESATMAAAGLVNARRKREGKTPVDPQVIKLISGLKSKVDPSKKPGIVLNFGALAPAVK